MHGKPSNPLVYVLLAMLACTFLSLSIYLRHKVLVRFASQGQTVLDHFTVARVVQEGPIKVRPDVRWKQNMSTRDKYAVTTIT